MEALIICVSRIDPSLLPSYYATIESILHFGPKNKSKLDFLIIAAHFHELNPNFLSSLNASKCLALDMLSTIATERLPKLFDKPQVFPLETARLVIKTTTDTKVLERCRQLVMAVGKQDIYRIDEIEIGLLIKSIEELQESIQNPSSVKKLVSIKKMDDRETVEDFSPKTPKKPMKFSPKGEITVEKLTQTLEKLIFEYSKGYAPTTLYHIDILNIPQVYRIIGNFIVMPETLESNFLTLQSTLATAAQIGFKTFNNLRAFMAFSFLMDSRIIPSAMVFNSGFSEISLFSQALALCLMAHRPNTLSSNSMTWTIGKLYSDSLEDLLVSLASDAVIKYLQVTESGDPKLKTSRRRLICYLLDCVLGVKTPGSPVKIDVVFERHMKTQLVFPNLQRHPSQECLQKKGQSTRVLETAKFQKNLISEADLESNFQEEEEEEVPKESNSEVLDAKLLDEINNLDGHSDDNEILQENDLRSRFVKSFIPFPKFAVTRNIREISMSLMKLLHRHPLDIRLLSEQQLSQRSIKSSTQIKSKDVKKKFMKLIHKESFERSNSQRPLKSILLPEPTSDSQFLPAIRNRIPSVEIQGSQTKVMTKSKFTLAKNEQSSENPKYSANKITLPSFQKLDYPVTLAPLASIPARPRTLSIEMTPKQPKATAKDAASRDKPQVYVLPPGKTSKTIVELDKPRDKTKTQKDFFFTKASKTISEVIEVEVGRHSMEASFARDLLYCKTSAAWTKGDSRLMNIVLTTIRSEIERYNTEAWHKILLEGPKAVKSEQSKTILGTVLEDGDLIKKLLQVCKSQAGLSYQVSAFCQT